MEFLNETSILFRLLRSSRVRNLLKLSRKVNTLSKEKTIAEINFAKLIYNKILCNSDGVGELESDEIFSHEGIFK